MVYVIVICMAVPLLLLMTLLQRQARLLCGFMVTGMVMAVCAYEVNMLLCALLQIDGVELSVRVAPMVEEAFKAMPILLYAILISDDRRVVLQLSMAVGVGFAILENAFLLLINAEQVNVFWALVRGVSSSLSHGICTLIVGCGVTLVRRQKKLFCTGIFALLSAAMTFHAIFNLLLQTRYDYIALALPIITYGCFACGWLIRKNKQEERAALQKKQPA